MSMDDHELSTVLHRATQSIDAPVLAARALRSAQRRRTRRRGAAAAVLSSALVVAVVVATQVGGGTSVAPPTSPSQTPTAPTSPGLSRTEGPWDPRTVDDLPPARAGLSPTVPAVIDPPESSPLLADDPIGAAVLVVEQGDVAQLLGVDGSWRTVPLDQRYPGLELSPDGRRLAISYVGGDAGATLYDVTTGDSRVQPFPEGYQPFDFSYWTFADDDTLCLCGASEEIYLVDAVTGAAQRQAHGADVFDPDGAAVEADCCVGPQVLTDWAGGSPREVDLQLIGRPSSISVGLDTVAATSYDPGPLEVVLADRSTLSPRATLPVRDPQGAFGDGGLSVATITDDGTVLLRVAVLGRDGDGFRVVAWDPALGTLSLVSTNPVARQVAFADSALRQARPGTQDPEATTSASTIDPDRVQPAWDPDDVRELPAAGVLLPAVLVPEGDPGPVRGSAVAAADADGRCWVLGTSGEWTSTAYPEPELPFVGRQVAIASSSDVVVVTGRRALWRRDVSSGDWIEVPYPAGFRTRFDYSPTLAVDDDGRILLGQDQRWWLIDTDGGAPTRLPFDRFDDVMTSGGDVLASRFANTSPPTRAVEEWRSGSIISSQDATGFQSLQRPVADERSIAFARARTGYTVPASAVESDGLLALDRDGLTTRAFLPVPSRASYYSDNGGLSPVGWLDPDTVLVAVRPRSDPDTTWLVTWDVETGELARAASYATGTRIVLASVAL